MKTAIRKTKGNAKGNAVRLSPTSKAMLTDLAERFDLPKTLVAELSIEDAHRRAQAGELQFTLKPKAVAP